MRKLWLALCLAVCLAAVGAGAAWAAEATAPVYLNGERSELQALVVNGVSYLPLRELAEVFDLDIDWNQGEKRVDLRNVDRYYRVWVERRMTAHGYQSGGKVEWYDEYELDYTPLLRGGKVWLSLRFFEDTTEARIGWDTAKRAVCIEGVPIWQNGRWMIAPGFEAQPKRDELGNGWLTTHVGDLTMGYDYLWWLGADGSKRRINRGWMIGVNKAFAGKCVYYVCVSYLGGTNRYYVDGAGGGDSVRLGLADMHYGVGFKPVGGGWETDGEGSFTVEPDGTVIATGVVSAAISEFHICDEELARETYGLYWLTPGGHELIEKLELPRQLTVREIFEQGGLIRVSVEVNGKESSKEGIWLERLGPEPFLAVRDVCGLLGCELIWRQETDQLEIVAEGQRLIINCNQKLGQFGAIEGSEVRAVRISTGAEGKEDREEFAVLLGEFYFMRTLPWDFYQGLNGAELEWDREASVIRLTK